MFPIAISVFRAEPISQMLRSLCPRKLKVLAIPGGTSLNDYASPSIVRASPGCAPTTVPTVPLVAGF